MVAVRGYRVLIVEDEYLLAQDLGRYFTSMGAVVLGPVGSIAAAQQQVEQADAAVLDVDINGQKVFPIADRLADRGVPFVFFTGRDDIAIPLRFRNTGYLSKPSSQRAVFDALLPFGHLDFHRRIRRSTPCSRRCRSCGWQRASSWRTHPSPIAWWNGP